MKDSFIEYQIVMVYYDLTGLQQETNPRTVRAIYNLPSVMLEMLDWIEEYEIFDHFEVYFK